MAYRPERGWGFQHPGATGDGQAAASVSEIEELRRRIAELENSLKAGGR